MRLPVSFVSSYPFFVECEPDNFGRIFANTHDENQVAILRAIVEHMKPHRAQWDFIWVELNKPENKDVLEQLQECFRTLEAAT